MTQATGDGTLVIKNGAAPKGVPVVTLVIHGAAIGEVTGVGKIVIDDPTPSDGFGADVTGADWRRDSTAPQGGSETTWGGIDFRFRAVGGSYKITIYGSDVDLVASGFGTVIVAGSPDTLSGHDGFYSLNGADFKSLPATPTKLLTVGTSTSATPG